MRSNKEFFIYNPLTNSVKTEIVKYFRVWQKHAAEGLIYYVRKEIKL